MDKKEYDRLRYQRLKEVVKERTKKWWKENGKEFEKKRYATQKEKRLHLSKRYYKANKDKILQKQKEYRKENRDYYNNKRNEYSKNPNNFAKEFARTKTRALFLAGKLTKVQCSECGSTKRLEFHHSDYENNVVEVLCIWCHKKKHSKEGLL